jgi:hypothetical protein
MMDIYQRKIGGMADDGMNRDMDAQPNKWTVVKKCTLAA